MNGWCRDRVIAGDLVRSSVRSFVWKYVLANERTTETGSPFSFFITHADTEGFFFITAEIKGEGRKENNLFCLPSESL